MVKLSGIQPCRDRPLKANEELPHDDLLLKKSASNLLDSGAKVLGLRVGSVTMSCVTLDRLINHSVTQLLHM